MIAGGRDYHTPWKMTEVFDSFKTNSTLSFGHLPSSRIGAVGAMLGSTPILCGGCEYSDVSYCSEHSFSDSCISFQNSQWSQSHSMNKKRMSAAGVQVNSGTFWILGGLSSGSENHGGSLLDSTEFIIQGQTNGVPGPKLPSGLDNMCAVKVSEEEIFVIGGWTGTYYTNDVWIYNPQNGFSRTQGPSLKTKRRAHACSTMRDGEKTSIIVAGGYNDEGVQKITKRGKRLDSVEIYHTSDQTWHSGR